MDDAFCRQIREVAKRVRESSNRDGSDSPMKHEDNVSGTKEMIPRSKKPRMRTLPVNGFSRINWSRHEEILILTSIIDYEKEFGLSFSSDYDDLCRYVEKYIKASFTKKQLVDKIEYLKEKFLKFQARSNTNDGEIASSYTDNDDLFHMSMIIWGRNKTHFASVENTNQPKDVPFVEQETRDGEENRDVRSEENRDVPISEEACLNSNQPMDVPFVEQENRDVPISEEPGLHELHVLQEILAEYPSFKDLSKFQQKLLFAGLSKLGVEKKKELIDEWEALNVEEIQIGAKKISFCAKLATKGVSL